MNVSTRARNDHLKQNSEQDQYSDKASKVELRVQVRSEHDTGAPQDGTPSTPARAKTDAKTVQNHDNSSFALSN